MGCSPFRRSLLFALLSNKSLSHSPVDVSFPYTEGKVSMSEGARCESSAIHIGLNKLWRGRKGERREREVGREDERE